MIIICKICGKEFEHATSFHHSPPKTCSIECRNKNKIELMKKWRNENSYHIKQYQQEKNKIYYTENCESIKKKVREYSARNKDKISKHSKKYYKNNKAEINIRNKQYQQENKIVLNEKRKARNKKRREIDLKYKMRMVLRKRLNDVIKEKRKSSIVLLGCSIDFFINHIESRFTDGMTWENYGKFGWHIDHIIPCAAFDLTKEDEQRKCFHYTNLQPLWWRDNLSKGARIA